MSRHAVPEGETRHTMHRPVFPAAGSSLYTGCRHASILPLHLEHRHLITVVGDIVSLYKPETVQPGCNFKSPFADILKYEIGPEFVLVKIVFCFSYLLRVIPPVPWRERKFLLLS